MPPSSRPSATLPGPILVTGGFGFIGSHLIRHLLAELPEAQVVNLDLGTYAADPERLADLPVESARRLTSVAGDVADPVCVRDVLGDHRIEQVVHLAAESHVDRSLADGAPFVRTNVVGTHTLVEAARTLWGTAPGHRFLQVSTDEVFGHLGPGDPPFTPDSPYRPRSPYAASKAGADHLAMAAFHSWGFPVILAHSGNNYGPWQHREKFVPTVIRAARDGNPVPIYGTGENVREWVHVEDHAAALLRILQMGKPGHRYLVGSGEERSNLALARSIIAMVDDRRPQGAPRHHLLAHVPDRPGHDLRYAVDASRLRHQLGWTPSRSLAEGLAGTVAWYLERDRRSKGQATPLREELY